MSDESSGSTVDYSVYPELRREDVEVQEQLGVGTFGSVYKGVWRQSPSIVKEVAMKKVFMLEKEAEILSKIRHRNIIEFYGICKSTSDFYIVTECAENGSLFDVLHENKGNSIDFTTTLQWATEIAAGIHYLHYDAVVTIIHRDLKSKNVVLDGKRRCKICDFGTSKDLTHSCTAPTWGGTAAWMSPEIINQNEGLTTATDVWSYGVVLWEMLSREVPYKDFTEFRIYTLITQQGVTLVIPDTCPKQLANLMHGCWKMNPKDRTNMRKVVQDLTSMSKNQNVRQECQKFLEHEDWTAEIERQKKEIEDLKKSLEKKKEQLVAREKALERKSRRIENTLIASSSISLPESVPLWNERNVSDWMGRILGRTIHEKSAVEKVKTYIFRHRITGTRLLEMSQKDLEHIGIGKLGSRLEVMNNIRRLKEDHNKFVNFPTLEHANMMQLVMKSEKEVAAGLVKNTSVVLILGMYQRIGRDGRQRFKFYLDCDWSDEESSESRSPCSFVKTVCFCILDNDTNTPINEPVCYANAPCCSMDWMRRPEDTVTVKVITNVHYADVVSQPRSTELVALVSFFDRPATLIEKEVNLKLRKLSNASPRTGITQSPSTPHLRGVWQRKATESRHALTEAEIASINSALLAPRTPTLAPNGVSKAPNGIMKSPANLSPTTFIPDRSKSRPRRRKTKSVNVENEKHPTAIHGGNSKWSWKSQPKGTLN